MYRLPMVLVFVLGCASMDTAVRDRFTATYTCRNDHITVVARRDVPAHTVTVVRGDPPADVVGDPLRLRLWSERQARREAQADDDDDVFDASGCGHDERYACHRNADDQSVFCQDGAFVRSDAATKASLRKAEEARQNLIAQERAELVRKDKDLVSQPDVLTMLMEERLGFRASERQDGLVVTSVRAGGPADGRLEIGDVVVNVDGFRVARLFDLALAMHQHPKVLTIGIQHNGAALDVSLDLPAFRAR